MYPPSPFPPPPPGTSPAATAAALTRALTARGLTGIYTATAARFALVSVTAEVTAWTNGARIWCTRAGQQHTWPAAGIETAATALAALARPAPGSWLRPHAPFPGPAPSGRGRGPAHRRESRPAAADRRGQLKDGIDRTVRLPAPLETGPPPVCRGQ
jgi:hypothetical protein